MRQVARALVVGAVAAFGSACVTVTPVRGPDGETAHLIKCTRTEGCYERAAELCPDGYVVRTGGSVVSGSVSGGSGYVQSTSEVLVSCKGDLPAPTPGASPRAASIDERRLCDAAYGFIDGFAAYWARASQGKPLDEKVSREDFVATCRLMPENVQRCMHDKYRTAHAQACDAVLLRLAPDAHSKVDALFLQAHMPAAPKASATGTTAEPASR
jgi:hypothetical protein